MENPFAITRKCFLKPTYRSHPKNMQIFHCVALAKKKMENVKDEFPFFMIYFCNYNLFSPRGEGGKGTPRISNFNLAFE